MSTAADVLYPPGGFVLFSLNPSATVAPFEDGQADDAASKLATRKYLGWIEYHHGERYYRNQPTHELTLFVVSQRPPTPTDMPLMDEISFLPIWPASHPLGRQPLRPSSELPWSNCVQHCRPAISFTIAIEHRDNPTGITLTKRDLHRIDEAIDADWERLEEMLLPDRGLETEALRQPGDSKVQEDANPSSDSASSLDAELVRLYRQRAQGRHSGDAESDCYSEHDVGNTDSESMDESFLESLLATIGTMPPKVDIWFDLSTATELGDPEDLWEEMDEIEKIEGAAKEQIEDELREIAKKKAQNLEWVKKANQALGDEHGDTVSINTVADVPVTPVADDNAGEESTAVLEALTSNHSQTAHRLRSRVAAVGRIFVAAVLRCICHRANKLETESSTV